MKKDEKNSEFSSMNRRKKKDELSEENYITLRFVLLAVLLISLKNRNK